MKQEYTQRIDKLLLDYGRNVKPLIGEIAQRHKDRMVPDNILNEIRALNDHIARCYRDNVDDDYIKGELGKAEGHLRRLLYDCFKQLNIYISDNIKRWERWTYSSRWLYREGGNFWKHYTKWRRNAQKDVIEAKKLESVDPDQALKRFESAYRNYRNIEELFKNNRRFLVGSAFSGILSKAFSGFGWLIVTMLLSVVAVFIQKLIF